MHARRLPLLALGMLALLTGMWAGLLRLGWPLGWDWPAPRPTFGLAHGPLMISGFLGTMIGLERAVALGRSWAFAIPVLTAVGVVALLAGASDWIAALAMTAASLVLAAAFAVIVWRQTALFSVTMGLGTVAWFLGNGLWLGGAEVPEVVSWWMAFPVLTIAGERLELTRMLPPRRSPQQTFLVVVAVLLAGVALGGVASNGGARVVGVGFLGLTLWLARHDIARRTVRQPGLPRFTAICLLSAYAWLAVGGVLAIACGGVIAGPQYDAVVHAVLLGFVFAMIFGHAPIIFPAILGVAVPFHARFYAHVVLLHASLAVRLLGDGLAIVALRRGGGLLNAAAIVLFLASTVGSVLHARRAGA